MATNFAWTALVTLFVLVLYLVLSINVGRARRQFNVPAPKVSGDEGFERVFRVQQNTAEQLPYFLPALWLFAWFVSPEGAAILGTIWIIGRMLYAWGYYQEAAKRAPGFAIGSLSTLILIVGTLVKVIQILLAR